MNPEERQFLQQFFGQVMDRALDPRDPLYVDLYGNKQLSAADPVELLSRTIQWTPGESTQLFSGFRGTGKSTELRRLHKALQDQGYLVVRRATMRFRHLHGASQEGKVLIADVPDAELEARFDGGNRHGDQLAPQVQQGSFTWPAKRYITSA